MQDDDIPPADTSTDEQQADTANATRNATVRQKSMVDKTGTPIVNIGTLELNKPPPPPADESASVARAQTLEAEYAVLLVLALVGGAGWIVIAGMLADLLALKTPGAAWQAAAIGTGLFVVIATSRYLAGRASRGRRRA